MMDPTIDKSLLYHNLNEGVLEERRGAFERNLRRNLPLIGRFGGLAPVVPEFKGRTAIVIGAGPSLEPNYDVLRKYQHHRELAYIATDMALRPLLRQGIRPGYVFSCETSPVDYFGGLDTSGIRLMAFSCMAHINLRKWKGDVSFYNWMIRRPEYDTLWERAGMGLGFVATGGLVTTQAVAFALGCGIAGLVMAGNDLGFSDRFYARETAAHLRPGAAPARIVPLETIEMGLSRRAMEYRLVRGGTVFYTTRQFLAAKMWLEDLFKGRKGVYDCSNPGCSEKYVAKIELARFLGTIAGGKRRRKGR
ncbi:MAG: DUF115 domain-containing protein [Chrysiogenales bacterium]|nr:MAG: DUF115 domain-containing protein [Chrysiogenales bacterium]